MPGRRDSITGRDTGTATLRAFLFLHGLCVVFRGIAKVEVSEGVRALDRKSACEVGRNYAKFEFTVVNNVEN